MKLRIERDITRKLLPLCRPARFKGARGGRSSGKSHFFAEEIVERAATNPNDRVLCIREIQRSLKYSAKHLIEKKIDELGLNRLFIVHRDEILRRHGKGVIAFTGMQDHTADSLKSFEDFKIAWFEEAQRMSKRSRGILIPTIRMPGSQLWFSWNPELPDDPVEKLFAELADDPRQTSTLVTINYLENSFCPDEARLEAERLRRTDPDAFDHVWMGGYNRRNDAQVLAGKWRVDEFEPGRDWDGPYFGADWGFASDPTTLVRFWLAPGRGDSHRLMIEHEAFGYGVDLMDLPDLFAKVPGARDHVIRADPSRPETIAHMRRFGFRVEPAPQWQSKRRKGPVEDGIAWLRKAEEIVIHNRCTEMIDEAKLWCYKVDRITGDPKPDLAEGHEHGWDGVRYGAAPMIQTSEEVIFEFA